MTAIRSHSTPDFNVPGPAYQQPVQPPLPPPMPTAPDDSGIFDPGRYGLGAVMPVFGAHAQAGTSGFALAIADTAASRGMRVLLVDCSDPARSGLAGVCAVEGRSVATGDGRAAIRLAIRDLPRGRISVRRLVSTGTPMKPDNVPPPHEWAVADVDRFDLTVVDIGWDVWPLTAPGGRLGPLAWCMALRGTTFPVLAMKVTAGSVGLAEGVLARYTVGVQRLGLVDLYAVAAIGGDEWSRPAGMVIGHFLHARAARTLFTPASPEAELTGWTTAPTPATSTPIATTLLYGLGGAIANAVGPPPTAQQRRKRRASR